MENQNEIVLKINRDEIYFSCKGYSEEFINAISDVINQRRQSLIESSSTSKLEELPSAGHGQDTRLETKTGINIDINADKIKDFGIDLKKEMEKTEMDIINRAMKISGGIKEKAAKMLGLNRTTLIEKLKRYEKIEKPNSAKAEKQGKRYYKTYKQGEKERIIEDVRNGFSFEEINKKYNISINTYYRIKKNIEAEAAADKSSNPAAKISTADNGSSKHRKVGFNPTSVSEEDKLNIAEDIKLGLLSSQILKKYHINIHAYAEIKKSIKMEKQKPSADTGENDIESVKKRLDYGKHFDGDFGPLSANPEVRDWQKDMIARGL